MQVTPSTQDIFASNESPMALIWQEIQGQLSEEFGANTYRNWLAHLSYQDFLTGRFVIAAPSRFMRDWVANNCAQKILNILKTYNPAILALDIVVDHSLVTAPNTAIEQDENEKPPEAVTSLTDDPENMDSVNFDLESLGSRLEPKYKFENFVVGQSNELAHAAALRVAESDKVHFNPLFLYGGVGLGKTHLMHAIAWHIKGTHPHRKVVYLSAEKFMYHFVKALRFKNTVAFKEKFRSVDVLMIDDFQFISGKESTQEEFFHTFNALVDQNHQVIISADKSPSDLEGLEERLRSRLGWGLVADIHPTTYELRLGILQSKAESLAATVPTPVIEFLAHKITSNVRELEGALNRLVAHATLVGREISLETTQDVLRDLLRANDRRVTIDDIQKKVAEHFNIKVADMHSTRRQRVFARARQVAMYLCKALTSYSLPEIGRKFGGRDHTTVLHAVRKINELLLEDVALREDIDLLKRMMS